MVSWFAGLFYIVRLFIYHTEADTKPESEKLTLQSQFIIMEKRLWNIITVPAMILTLLSGFYMLYISPDYLKFVWMHLKLTFVLGLLIYQFFTWKILKNLQQNIVKKSSKYLRIWNEIATLLLVCIVFLVSLKHATNWIYGVLGLVLFGLVIFLLIRLIQLLKN